MRLCDTLARYTTLMGYVRATRRVHDVQAPTGDCILVLDRVAVCLHAGKQLVAADLLEPLSPPPPVVLGVLHESKLRLAPHHYQGASANK